MVSARRALTHVAVATAALGMLVALVGCGSSKPSYCSDRTDLENSVKGLTSAAASGNVSGLKSQITTIESAANSVVSSAKSDFPSQTTAVKTSVDKLGTAVKALPSSPSTAQKAGIVTDAAGVVSSVKSFEDASSSKCS